MKAFTYSIAAVFVVKTLMPAPVYAYRAYNPNKCAAPKKLTEKVLVEVSSNYFPTYLRDQGRHGTCYSFATQFLLQYLLNKSTGTNKNTKNIVSVVDLISRYRRGNLAYPNSGNPAILLQKIRNSGNKVCADDFENSPGDYKRFFGTDHYYLRDAIAKDDYSKFISWVNRTTLPGITSIHEVDLKAISQDQFYYSVDTIYRLNSCKQMINLPEFNLDWINLAEKQKASVGSSEKQETYQKELRELVISELKKGYPVAIGDPVHVTVVTGVKEKCCDDQCHFEWAIDDSMPQEGGPWFPQSEFANVKELVSVEPCKTDFANSADPRPACNPILHEGNRMILARTDDLTRLQPYLMDSSISQETKLKWLEAATLSGAIQIPQWFINEGGYSPSLILPSGKPILHAAIQAQSMDLVDLLLKKGADPNQRDNAGNPPLLSTIKHEQLGMMNLLKKYKADLSLKDAKGRGPLDWETGPMRFIKDHIIELLKAK